MKTRAIELASGYCVPEREVLSVAPLTDNRSAGVYIRDYNQDGNSEYCARTIYPDRESLLHALGWEVVGKKWEEIAVVLDDVNEHEKATYLRHFVSYARIQARVRGRLEC